MEQMQNMSDYEFAIKLEDFCRDKADICKIMNKECEDVGDCTECVKKWLKAEHKEPIKLSEAERVILENLEERYKWIARDDDGELAVFSRQPGKIVEGEGGFWCRTSGEISNLGCFNHLFQFIKWSDNEAYEIAELLKGE